MVPHDDTTDDGRTFVHRPVMVDEVVALVADIPPGEMLDATVGGGGHATAILTARDDLGIVGLDRDPVAIAAAQVALAPFEGRVRLVRTRFDHLAEVLAQLQVDRLSGFLFDLGVSSPQLDDPERGFSFRHDGPLDMRMDTDGPKTAADVVNLSTATTVNGEPLTIRVEEDTVMVNDANVIKTDIPCSNGVIHVIDTVLTPSLKV